MTFIHPDDIESPRFGGWADNFNTYTEACEYYGADTPAGLAIEAQLEAQEAHIEAQDDIEARGGPRFGAYAHFNDEIWF